MSVTLHENKATTSQGPLRGLIFDGPIGMLAALQFLTIVPPFVRRPFTATELGRAVGWFALVGLVLGVLLTGTDYVLGLLLPRSVTAAVILGVWVLATGALHLDGLLDSCDGLFGGRTPEARLRIMRDERVGAYAVIGGALVLLLKYACLAALIDRTAALILAPTLGRWAICVVMVILPYGRSEGLGRDMKDHAGWWQIVQATCAVLATILLVTPLRGAVALVGAVLTAATLAIIVLRRLPGFTGDGYGALCELVETATLLVFVAGEMP